MLDRQFAFLVLDNRLTSNLQGGSNIILEDYKMAKCTVEGCSKTVIARGWCPMHYRRWKKYGDTSRVEQRQIHGASLRERFLSYVQQGVGCWRWVGSKDANGYGRLHVGRLPELAHRISWALFNGEIPSGAHVLHRCDNPQCVRPDHLFLGNQADNNADKMSKNRHRFGVSRGVAHGRARVTEEQVRFIRMAAGSSREIAASIGNRISSRQVRDIRSGRLWRHIK
jgi:hypothetical protein